MSERTAAQVFTDLQGIAEDLRDLEATGKVSMAHARENEDFLDTAEAMTVARNAVQVALDATRWMITEPS